MDAFCYFEQKNYSGFTDYSSRELIKLLYKLIKVKSWLNKNFPENSSTVIPNPVVYPLPLHNERSIKPDSLVDKDKRIILASGRMHKYKQFDLLIRAFNAIKDHHTQWELVIFRRG